MMFSTVILNDRRYHAEVFCFYINVLVISLNFDWHDMALQSQLFRTFLLREGKGGGVSLC